jgi:site-specific recombinase XerD
MLYRAGLRCNEALALRAVDLDLDAGSVRVLHGKGDTARTVGLDPGALAVIEKWLRIRRGLPNPRAGRLFCTLAGTPISDVYVRQMTKRLAKRARLTKRVHAHGLRHTHAAELAREGVPMNVIRDQLGHKNLATTDRYVRGLCPADVVAAMQARTWTL